MSAQVATSAVRSASEDVSYSVRYCPRCAAPMDGAVDGRGRHAWVCATCGKVAH